MMLLMTIVIGAKADSESHVADAATGVAFEGTAFDFTMDGASIATDNSEATAADDNTLKFTNAFLPSGTTSATKTYTLTAKANISSLKIYYTMSDSKFTSKDQSKSGNLIYQVGDAEAVTSSTTGNKSNTTAYVETITNLVKDDVVKIYSSSNRLVIFAVYATYTPASPAKAYTVTVATNNSAYGTAKATDSSLDEGETTTVTATNKAGYEFTSWSVEGEGASLSSTTDNPTTLTMGTSNATVTATFTAVNLGITYNNAENGTYTISVAGGEATSGNTTATIGQTITLAGTPAAASFTEVAWNVKDADDNEVTVTDGQFTMPGKAVTISPVFSKPYFVKVAIKNKNSADITGTASSDATADVNCQDNTKLGSKGHYVGFTLASETFQAGDIVEVKISEAGGGSFIFYDSKEQTNTILSTDVTPAAGTYKFALPASAEGENSLYLVRGQEENSGFNPYVTYIAIIRPDATITLNAKGFATYSSAVDFEYAGADAYGMKLTETSLVGTKVTSGKIKAGEGILFKGEAGATVAITETTGAEAIGDANNLIGTTNASEDIISSSPAYKYALSGDTFMTFTGSLQKNKAFFGSDTAIAASLDLVFDDEATAINNVNANENVNASAPVKVIKNGKLYIGNYNVAGQQVK